MHLGLEELGREAARLLLEMVRGRHVPDGPHRVPTSFVPRESCGCSTASTLDAIGQPDLGPLASVRDRLRFRLARLLQMGERPAAEHAAALDVAALVLAQLTENPGEEGSPSPAQIQEAAEALCLIAPRWTTISSVAECLHAAGREVFSGSVDAQAGTRFEARITDLVVELARSLAQRDMTTNTMLHRVLRDGYELSMSLLSGHAEDPRSLQWLSRAGPGRLPRSLAARQPPARQPGGDRQFLPHRRGTGREHP